jgi:hypothetical protein
MVRSFLLAAAALTLTACATGTSPEASNPPANSSDDCFRNSMVGGFNVVDAHRIRVMAGSRHYLLTIDQPTTEINQSASIAVESGRDRICVGDTLGVAVLNGGVRYPVSRIERDPATVDPTGS